MNGGNHNLSELKLSDLDRMSREDRRAFQLNGCMIILLICAGLVSLGVLVYTYLTVPSFRLSIAAMWGSATLFLVGLGMLKLSERSRRLITASQEPKQDDPSEGDSN